ncbi:MAG: hypothetical protein IAE91_04455 [Ignavibacteriaceae bacterium]|nr:hypothetical protein [Ignavibacteriaceae bacterium]
MIIWIIFYAHILFALIIFAKKYQDENISSALLNIGLIGLLFSVGWSIASLATKYVISEAGFGTWFDRDTITLTILSIGEYFFYKGYYGKDFTQDGN